MKMRILLSLMAAGLCGGLSAAVRPSALFSDHAVLLRSADTPVFGEASPGETVDVSLGGVRAGGVAGKDGKWLVRLDLRDVGQGPFDLTINGRISKDVLVGEVWLCSGQSNMSFTQDSADDADTECALTNRLIRCFQVGGSASVEPVERASGRWVTVNPKDTPRMSAVGYQFAKCLHAELKRPVGFVVAAVGAASLETWCDPETMKVDPLGKAELDRQIEFINGYRQYEERCDAALRKWEKSCGRLDRPHGGIPVAGWKPIEEKKAACFTHASGAVWFRREVKATPGKTLTFARRRFIEQQWRFDSSTVEIYWNGCRLTRRFSADPIDKNTEYFDVAAEMVRAENALAVRVFNAVSIPNVFYGFWLGGRRLPYAGWSSAEEFLLKPLTSADMKSMPPTQLFCLRQHYPTGLYNGKIAGLVPMGLSGVIWYQGESNARRADAYGDLFRTFILSWRKLFRRDDLPFGWCQLAGYMRKATAADPERPNWPLLRDAQDATLSLPMTGQAVLIDAGESDDIHPRDKRTPGRRLAAWALNRVYGRKDIPYLGPRFDGVESRGSSLHVRFRDVADGLRVKDLGTEYIMRSSSGRTGPVRRNSPKAEVEGFALAGKDGVWHWADRATIEGSGVTVSCAAVPEPVSVRYGWSPNPWVNLYNSDGFPAVPFGSKSVGRAVKPESSGALSGTVLWPGDPAAVLKTQPDSVLDVRDGIAEVVTGTGYPWPGVRLDFKGMRDFSAYGMITVGVTNMSDRSLKVQLSVKAKALQGRSPGGEIQLMPRSAGELVVSLNPMPWKLDGPLEFIGMNGYPHADDGSGHLFDITKTTSFHIFRAGKAEPAHFGITGITVGGTPPARQKILKADTFLPFVDRFGQFKHGDWPGKIQDEADLAKARKDEESWLSANPESPIQGVGRFGGWAAGPKLKATGFFRTEKVNGKWWLVDPDGHLFFSHGVDLVNPGNVVTATSSRERYFEWLPKKDDPVYGGFWGVRKWAAAHGYYSLKGHYPYETYDFGRANMVRKYGAGWLETSKSLTHRRMRAWGLNTIANWSHPDIYGMRRTPYTMNIGTWGTPRRAGSKGWWGPLPDPFNPEFERIFRDRVKEAAKKMKDDPWCIGVFVDNELSWDNLPDVAEVAEKYFTVISSVLRKELPNHLYLGCRIAWGSDTVYRAAARHCDVVSVNIYERMPTRDLPEGCEDKPMINGEFHCGALDRGMFHTGLVAAGDQKERAQCYRDFVNGCLDHPRMVGTHWFQWRDHALTGRDDGENYQIGFVTVADAPYPELVEAARDVASGMYRRRFEGRKSR